ncbi:complement C4-B, partial [Bombina bombina]|uniref:complement C4-B n=1 Tax=Bombina bombina TaxID=8345 RepID=UPI00235AEF2C
MGLPQPLLRCVLWAAIFTGITAQTPNFLAVAPRIIHVGVEESVGVQFEWPSGSSPPAGDIQVKLYLRNQLNMAKCSEQKTVILNRANNYIKIEKLQITFLQATTCKLDTTKVNRYVQLAVESSVLGDKKRAVSIPVSYQRGYLFIQTDKSIYTPKEKVLPNFEVKIIPDIPYFLISKNELRFRVEARYVYGEPVDGIAYVRVGIIDKDGQKSMLRGLEQQVKLKEGSMDITITKANISEKIKQPLDNLIGTNFYIAASVVEIASGALEEKELTSVKIVASPYILDLSKTKKYYIPSTPVYIVAEVSHADGSPAKGVDVRFTGLNEKVETIKSNDNGVATIHHNLNQDPKSLELTVSAGTSEGSVVETLHLLPYSSATKSFLHMSVPYQVLSPGESVMVTLKVVSAKENDVKKIYYMVLSKGQIISINYISKTDYINLPIPVTSSMVPSFRIVAYYHLHSEIVANSAWVDVTDECEGKLTLSHKVKDYIEPGASFDLDMVTDDNALVSLSAVDTAVYILNSKNKLTLGKMFKAMNLYDLGCSPGGGKDYKNVFMDAGLAFVSKDEYSNLNGFSCKVSQRKKRNIEFSLLTQQKVNSYPTRELQRCCGDGMTLLPRKMKRTCVQRAVRIPSQSCKEAFRTCCDYAEKLRLEITLKKRKTQGLGRTQEVGQDDEDDFADENDIQYRTYFPESWLFKTVNVDKKESIHLNIPDSITTWEIQGIGMSARKGFCIAEPVKLKVFKPFHIHLRVPYSIKRFEQMEIRPVLYNYNDKQLKVRVYMEQAESICSPAKDIEGSDGIRLTLPANSATAVSFPVVPIGKSSPVITIVALGQNGITDSIRKPLKIVREGTQVLEEKTYIVDPK